jgi:hypothetical protein
MNYLCLILIFMSATPLLAEYLGTNRADVEAGLRAYTEKQLSDMKRKERSDGMKAEPILPEKPEEIEEKTSASWDDEIAKLLQAEAPKQKHSSHRLPKEVSFENVSPIFPIEPVHKKIDWQQTASQNFSAKEKSLALGELVTIPSGSYIMADLLSGVDAPTQTSIPILIRTRFGFVSPNDGFVDLSGCHVIAQATGDLSTERVKIKTVSLSCLSPDKVPQEQNFSAFGVAEDGSFAIPGELRSRQGRVAMMAFLNGVVEGATKIASETSSTVISPMSALSNQGSSSAAVEVMRWYLEHAKALVPTVEVKAGVPIRLVLLEPLIIPRKFFTKYSPHKESNHVESDLIY